jgi:hypothetical protein
MDTSDLTGRLLEGEKIVWWGQPAQGLLFTARDWLLRPFSLLWGGFAVFWESSVLATGAPIFMKLWGVPFVLIGLYLVAGRFLLDSWTRRRMLYAVTNQRILILRNRPFAKFTALVLDRIPDVNLNENGNGSGTIRFGMVSSYWSGREFSGWAPSLDRAPQFIAIKDARRVFDHIQRRS